MEQPPRPISKFRQLGSLFLDVKNNVRQKKVQIMMMMVEMIIMMVTMIMLMKLMKKITKTTYKCYDLF